MAATYGRHIKGNSRENERVNHENITSLDNRRGGAGQCVGGFCEQLAVRACGADELLRQEPGLHTTTGVQASATTGMHPATGVQASATAGVQAVSASVRRAVSAVSDTFVLPISG